MSTGIMEVRQRLNGLAAASGTSLCVVYVCLYLLSYSYLRTRQYVASTGKAVVNLLGIKRGTNASSYVQLYVGFLTTGLTHVWGDRQIDVTVGRSVPFFLLQAVAITFEDGVIAIGRSAGIKESAATRMIGRVWSAAWLLATLKMLVDPALSTGEPVDSGLPFSVIGAVWRAAGMEGKMNFSWPEPIVI